MHAINCGSWWGRLGLRCGSSTQRLSRRRRQRPSLLAAVDSTFSLHLPPPSTVNHSIEYKPHYSTLEPSYIRSCTSITSESAATANAEATIDPCRLTTRRRNGAPQLDQGTLSTSPCGGRCMRCPLFRRSGQATGRGLFPAVTRFPRADHGLPWGEKEGQARADRCRGFHITSINTR